MTHHAEHNHDEPHLDDHHAAEHHADEDHSTNVPHSSHSHGQQGHDGHHHGGHHHGGHSHGGHHHPAPTDYSRAFIIGLTLNLGFVGVEVVFGLLAHSIALLADAGHNLSDVLGLLLAWGASILTRRRPSSRYTYGWRRSSILAAFLNAIFLLVVTGGLAWEAIQRFGRPDAVQGGTIAVVAVVGIIINTLTALMFVS